MKQAGKIRTAFYGFTKTITRFPLTVIFLMAAATLNAIIINSHPNENRKELFITFLIGAALFIVLQLINERIGKNRLLCILFMAACIIMAAAYYFILRRTGLNNVVMIRTYVIFFILLISFIWIPSIRSRISFNETFMAAFKAFFIAFFFSGVLFLGASLILGAINMLITPINGNSYTHAANIIFILYAPMHFLSLVPVYPNHDAVPEQVSSGGTVLKPEEDKISEISFEKEKPEDMEQGKPQKDKQNEISFIKMDPEKYKSENNRQEEINEGSHDFVKKATEPAKLLEYLISYVVIPITAIFTVILLLYIVLNITGKFWKDNLLEPLLVSYSITVIIVYILTGRLENAFVRYFRKIFPKVLVPIVLFQTIASVLKIDDLGVTYGRYYAILFGIYAAIAGILFCIVPVRKNGIIAPILIILSIISILPPVDAFTISRINQTGRLKAVLINNGMLKDNSISPNADISEKDKKIIINSINYLNQTQDIQRISWLTSYNSSNNFERTFGFEQYYTGKENKSINLYADNQKPVDIAGYDFILDSYINLSDSSHEIGRLQKNGKTYVILFKNSTDDRQYIILEEEKQKEFIQFDVKNFFANYEMELSGLIPSEKARYTIENSQAILTLVVKTVNINYWQEGSNQQAEVYFLVRIK